MGLFVVLPTLPAHWSHSQREVHNCLLGVRGERVGLVVLYGTLLRGGTNTVRYLNEIRLGFTRV